MPIGTSIGNKHNIHEMLITLVIFKMHNIIVSNINAHVAFLAIFVFILLNIKVDTLYRNFH